MREKMNDVQTMETIRGAASAKEISNIYISSKVTMK